MSAVLTAVKIIGSIAVFMIGFNMVTDTLLRYYSPFFQKLIGGRHKRFVSGFFNGALAAALAGSISSGVVFLISMVNSRIVILKKTQWILPGINLGATASGWIIALSGYYFGLTGAALLIIAAALPFKISSYLSEYNYGDSLTGLGLALLGIDMLNGNLHIIPADPLIVYYLRYLTGSPGGFFVFLISGILVASLIRSSTGVLVLAMSLGFRGWLAFDMCAAVVLGSNLGITIIGFLASRSLGCNARRTALMHLFINISAVIWGIIFFSVIIQTADAVMPGYRYIPEFIPSRLAFFHSFIHLLNPLFLLPLHSFLFFLCIKVIPECAELSGRDKPYNLNILPRNLPESLDSNTILIQSGLVTMAEWTNEMLMIVMNISQSPVEIHSQLIRVREIKKLLDTLEDKISSAVTSSVQQQCTRYQAEKIKHQNQVSKELKKIGEACLKSMDLLTISFQKQFRFHETGREELFVFTSQILDFLRYISDYLNDKIRYPDRDLADKMENAIDVMREKLRKKARLSIEKSDDSNVKGELVFIEIIGHLEHIGDNCLSISETIPKIK